MKGKSGPSGEKKKSCWKKEVDESLNCKNSYSEVEKNNTIPTEQSQILTDYIVQMTSWRK